MSSIDPGLSAKNREMCSHLLRARQLSGRNFSAMDGLVRISKRSIWWLPPCRVGVNVFDLGLPKFLLAEIGPF